MQRADGWPGLRDGLRPAADARRPRPRPRLPRTGERRDRRRPTSTAPMRKSRTTSCVVLEDDRHYFPSYEAVYLYRADLAQRAPAWVKALQGMAGRIDAATMQRLNAQVKLEHAKESDVAAVWLGVAAPETSGPRRPHLAAHARASRAGRHLAGAGVAGRAAARHLRRAAAATRAGGPVGDRRAADAAVAGGVRVHDPAVRHRREAGDRGAVPLQPAADRAQHPRRHSPASRWSCARPPRRSACRRARGCGGSNCRWRCARSSPASRPRR